MTKALIVDMKIFRFLRSRSFFINLTLILVTVAVIAWVTLNWLDAFTYHDTSVAVPDFKGLKIKELEQFIADKDVRFEIVDSVYDIKAKKGVVLEQNPPADSRVKQNRKIYLTVSAVLSERIRMPELTSRTLRQARSVLASYDLNIDSIRYIPSIEKDAVLKQLYKGQEIKGGQSISKGSRITLVVGAGLSTEKTGIPGLYGLTIQEAKQALERAELSLGATVADPGNELTDTLNARVYDQQPRPNPDPVLFKGSTVDIYITNKEGRMREASLNSPDSLSASKDSIR
ncbi:MAG: PASTA domain-containing protein [Flavobacteriales bacterium]|nr:PASTA domain-containing protein [Flavobacteriales bacterium]